MADSSGEGEEEYEYEEVEVEVEEEEEYEEVEEEEEEEEEEVVKGDEQIQEEEPEEEEEYEEVEEEVEEEEEEEECEEIEEEEEEVEEEEEEEEYEEVEEEEEEEEEVGEEIETDAAIDEETATEAKAIDDVIAVATEAETVIDEEMAMEAEAEVEDEEAEAKAKAEAIYESAFRSSNMSLPVADRSLCDVRLEEESKSNDVCSRSRLQDTLNSEVAATLDVIHAVDGTVSTLRCPSPSQQNKKETDAPSIYGSVSLPERLNSVANTVETEQSPVEIIPLGTTVENHQSHVIHVTPAIASEEHDFTPVGINELCKVETTDIDDKRGPVESPLADTEKNQWTHDRCVASAVTTGEHVSAPDGTRDKICESETTDIAETRFPSQEEDPHLPPNESMDQNALRCHTPQLRPRSLSPGGASDVSNKRPALICEFFAKGWCIKGSSCRFLHKRDQVDHSKGHVEGDKPCPSKDSGGTSGASMSRGHNQPKSLLRNSDDLLPIKTGGVHTEKDYREPVHGKDNFRLLERDAMYRRLSSSSQISPSSKDSGPQMNSFHPFATVEESVAMRRQYTLDLHSSPICAFPSRSSNSVRNSSLLDDSSWKDMLNSYKKRRFTPYNWEPSTRFRPSCLTSFAASSSDVPYDPIRDSIEQSSLGHDPFRRCSYSQTQGLAYQNDQRLHSDSNDKEDYYSRNKDAGVVEAESGAVSATNPENKITSDENNPVVAASVKDVLKSTKSISDGSSKLKIDGPRHMGETGRHKKNGLDEDEARVIKIFRAALVDFVKELLKPVWHEGRLSKDVYKVIVQKAEDKILSTLPSNEVPDTSESINLYLSTSRPNILKLIQAYVDKYGKF